MHQSSEDLKLNSRVTRQTTSSNDLLTTFLSVFSIALGLQTSRLVLENIPQGRLEDDPMCGMTTGGAEECYWDCDVVRAPDDAPLYAAGVYSNPECLLDCFEPDHCISKLIRDYLRAGGTCVQTNLYPLAPVSKCQVPGGQLGCSPDTVASVLDLESCNNYLPEFLTAQWVIGTLDALNRTLCGLDITEGYKFKKLRRPNKRNRKPKSQSVRLNPLFDVIEAPSGEISRTMLMFNHTRHRYPWICSLRRKDPARTHLCAVTLLRRPPGPIVMVTPAHCVKLCKDGPRVLDNCCCDNVSGVRCSNSTNCGDSPDIVDLSKDDSEVVCGEWEIGSSPRTDSKESYNVIFNIKNVVIHPDFQISKGAERTQFVANDVATIHVEQVDRRVFDHFQIYPACLPRQQLETMKGNLGIHSGWSSPPPISYLRNFAPYYFPFYRDFRKQWHYKMEVIECKDPSFNFLTGQDIVNTTNTYYPPASLCAQDTAKFFCPTSGESGSPLMMKNHLGRFTADGVLSFIKGCSLFGIFQRSAKENYILQHAGNPAVYTKLTCFLPWIAEQYNLEYDDPGPRDPACDTGTGDKLDVTQMASETCGSNPNTAILYFHPDHDALDQKELVEWLSLEKPCIFPFYVDGQRYDTCFTYNFGQLTNPVFMCPHFSVTTKFEDTGIDSYTSENLQDLLSVGMCPVNTDDPNNSILDPNDKSCARNVRRIPFAQCKNNCPGVNFPVVAGGAALLFTSSVGGITALQSGAIGLGLLGAGVGGPMLAGSMCLQPMFCRNRSGQCCMTIPTLRARRCPRRC